MAKKRGKAGEKPDYFDDDEDRNVVSFVEPPASRLIVKRNGHSITTKTQPFW